MSRQAFVSNQVQGDYEFDIFPLYIERTLTNLI